MLQRPTSSTVSCSSTSRTTSASPPPMMSIVKPPYLCDVRRGCPCPSRCHESLQAVSPRMSSLSNDPRVTVYVGDGFKFLAGHTSTYDVIVTETNHALNHEPPESHVRSIEGSATATACWRNLRSPSAHICLYISKRKV
ncbi:hypothetical protein C2E23DRAFT_451227 [Lenzites betulinus]|nr:hypothetical protein C2E23DRAFT_451227 [Lenzites betulinus]